MSVTKIIAPPPLPARLRGWIGVDFDGTLVKYERWIGPDHVGEPIPAMVERVKEWLAAGMDVRIFTARVWSDGTPDRDADARLARAAIAKFCVETFGKVLQITCVKDFGMLTLYDDRCMRVETNTGRVFDELPEAPR